MSIYRPTKPATSMSAIHDLPIMPSIQQFAPIVNMPEKGLSDLCREDAFPAVKIGGAWRIRRDEALRFLGFEA